MSGGATRTPTIRVGQDNAATASPSPAAVPPVPSGVTMASGRWGSWNSRPRTLLPPQRGEDRSSRLSQSAAAPHAAARPGADSRGVGQSPRLPGASALRIFGLNAAALDTHAPFRRGQPMRVATDYIRHAARLARKSAGDPLGGAPHPPDPEFYGTLAKALEEIAAGLEQLGKEE